MTRTLITILLLPIAALLPAAPAAAKPCSDPAVIEDWEERAQRNEYDNDFQALHALWLGLCQKIAEGTIEEDRAREVFEDHRTQMLGERLYERQRRASGVRCGCRR